MQLATGSANNWNSYTVDATGDVGAFSQVGVDSDGKIYVLYRDNTNADLKYATNVSGQWITVTMDATGDVGNNISMAFDKNLGKMYFSYFDATNGTIKGGKDCQGKLTATSVTKIAP